MITKLPLAEQDDYVKLKEYLLKQYQLGSREYRARFTHATRNAGETWVAFTSLLTSMFRYYTNSRDCHSFEALSDLCVCDKLRDTLPPANLKHCLIAEKDQNMSAESVAKLADDYESNFWPDGRYKGQSVTVGSNHGPRFDYKSGNRDVADNKPGKLSSPRLERRQRQLQTNPVAAEARVNDPNTVAAKGGHTVPAQGHGQFGKYSVTSNIGKSPAVAVGKMPLRCWTCGELGH